MAMGTVNVGAPGVSGDESAYLKTDQVGVPGGLATLGADGYLTESQRWEVDAYKKTEIDTRLAGKANAQHTQDWSTIANTPAIVTAMGYEAETIEDLLEKVCGRYPQVGSVNFSNETRISSAWYNFAYIAHRTGVGDDNADWGTLLLYSMTFADEEYIVRVSMKAVQEIRRIYTSGYNPYADAVAWGNVPYNITYDHSYVGTGTTARSIHLSADYDAVAAILTDSSIYDTTAKRQQRILYQLATAENDKESFLGNFVCLGALNATEANASGITTGLIVINGKWNPDGVLVSYANRTLNMQNGPTFAWNDSAFQYHIFGLTVKKDIAG